MDVVMLIICFIYLPIVFFYIVLAIMLFRFLLAFPKTIENLPDKIAERMIEKLQEEERQK
jgi:hypothetical protein